MPAVNPRITITLTPAVHAVIQRLSQLGDESMSAIVGGLLAETLPVFERIAQVMEAAVKLRQQADASRQEFKDGLSDAQGKLEAQLGLALEHMDEGFRPILEAAEKVDLRARRAGGARDAQRAARAPDGRRAAAKRPTPMSNRGVTTPSNGPKQAKTKAKTRGGR